MISSALRASLIREALFASARLTRQAASNELVFLFSESASMRRELFCSLSAELGSDLPPGLFDFLNVMGYFPSFKLMTLHRLV